MKNLIVVDATLRCQTIFIVISDTVFAGKRIFPFFLYYFGYTFNLFVHSILRNFMRPLKVYFAKYAVSSEKLLNLFCLDNCRINLGVI